MTNLYTVTLILSGFALAGLIACFIDIRQAVTAGMGTAIAVIAVLCFLSLSSLDTNMLRNDFILKSGMPFLTLILVGLYYFFVMKNKTYVEDGLMPDVWYTFSYYIAGFTAFNIICMVFFFKNNDSVWRSMMLLGNTFLFAFVVIEWIVSTFYRTDGFRV